MKRHEFLVPALRSLALGAVMGLAAAADTVSVTTVVTAANEQDLSPGQVVFSRTGDSAPLTVRYSIGGDARSNLHGAHIAGAVATQLDPLNDPYPFPIGTGFRSTSPIYTQIEGGLAHGVFSSTTNPYRSPVTGNIVTGVEYTDVFDAGYGYRVPEVVVTDPTGSGAILKSVTTGGVITKVAVEKGGSGYAVPTMVFTGGGGTGAMGQVAVRGGRVIGVTLLNGGTGYTSSPTVTLTGAAAVPAVIRATVANGQVNDVVLDSGGSGYTTPTITLNNTLLPVAFTGGGGVGARGRATVVGGAITAVEILDMGSGYTTTPTVIVPSTSTGVAALTATINGSGQVSGVVVASGGSGYAAGAGTGTYQANVVFAGGGAGSGALAHVEVVGGVVTRAIVDAAGSGYNPNPTATIPGNATILAAFSPVLTADVTLVGGGGSGAVASLLVNNGVLSAIDADPITGVSTAAVVAGGAGYTTPPTVVVPAPGVGHAISAQLTDSLLHMTITRAAADSTAAGVAAAVRVVGGIVVQALITADGNNGYNTAPTVTLTSDVGGSGATFTATVVNGVVTAINVTNGGTGYPDTGRVYSLTVPPGGGGINYQGKVSALTITNPGVGYRSDFIGYATFTPAPGDIGSGAMAQLTFSNGMVTNAVVVSRGKNYGAVPSISISAVAGTNAVLTAVVDSATRQVTSVTINNPGSGYQAGTGALAEATVEAGSIIAVDLLSGGNGYGDASPVVTVRDIVNGVTVAAYNPAVQVSGPDYIAPVNTQVAAQGLTGTISFQAGELTKTMDIYPLRNGVGGGLHVLVNVENPTTPGSYIVGARNSARVNLSDADDRASIRVMKPVSYPIPPMVLGGILPTVVEGRGEWLISMTGDYRRRRQEIMVGGEPSLGPTAVNGFDYLLVASSETIDDTRDNVTYVCNLNETTALPSRGSTVIPVASNMGRQVGANGTIVGSFPPNFIGRGGNDNNGLLLDGALGDGENRLLSAGDVVCFEAPTDPENGVYVVMATSGPVQGTLTLTGYTGYQAATITISPPLRKISTFAGGSAATRVRRLGRLIAGINHYQTTAAQYQHLYAFAGQDNAPRGHLSASINMVQTNDFGIPTPAQGSVIVADTSVRASLSWGRNAGKPSINGNAKVTFDRPFPVDVRIPFFVKTTSTATYYNRSNKDTGDYEVPGVNAGTLIGDLLLPANTTEATIEVVPRMLEPSPPGGEIPETVELALADSVDYMIAPVGTAPVNPSVAVVISPPLYTDQNELVHVAVVRVNDGQEGASPTNGAFEVSLSSSTGAALKGVLTQNLTIPYSVSGSATASQDYQALSGQVVIPAGSVTAAITVAVIDDMIIEDSESVKIQLDPAPGYQISSKADASLFILDDEPRLYVSAKGNASESGSIGFFTVSTPIVVNRNISFTYTVSGTATPGEDYTALSGTGLIPAGQNSVTINVTATRDNVVDSGETVTIGINVDTLVPATYAQGTPSSDSIQIIDDMPLLLVSGTTDAIESGTAGAFVISNANVVNQAVTFTYIVTGTAVSGVDYVVMSGTATIAANASSVTIPVVPIPDLVYDPDETVVLSILNDAGIPPTYVVGSPSSGTVLIKDDSVPSINVVLTSNAVEGGAQGSFTFNASSAPSTAITVAYAIAGTATPGSDYNTLGGTVVIPAGATSVSVPVTAIFDGITDADETIVVTLQADANLPPLYVRGSLSTATMTIQNSSSPANATTPTNTIPMSPVGYMSAGGGGGGGCGVGSGLGLVGLGAGLALAAFLRRRRNAA